MNFEEFKDAVTRDAYTCGARSATRVLLDRDKRGDKLIAAAALVIADKGVAWAVGNRAAFQSEIFKYLGWAARLALLFVGGPWGLAARLLVPVIIELLRRQFSASGYGAEATAFVAMSDDAKQVLRGANR